MDEDIIIAAVAEVDQFDEMRQSCQKDRRDASKQALFGICFYSGRFGDLVFGWRLWPWW